jgi:hypothetical protein
MVVLVNPRYFVLKITPCFHIEMSMKDAVKIEEQILEIMKREFGKEEKY